MADQLSPAAQAVLDAVTAELDWDAHYHSHSAAAAALRAAADQVVPLRDAPKIAFDAKRPTLEWHVWHAKQRARADLLSIAAELKAL